VGIEAAIIGVDRSGKAAVLKPPLWQIAIALVGVCEQPTDGSGVEHGGSPPEVIVLSQECVQAIAGALASPTKIATLYGVLLSDEAIQAQTNLYVVEERALFETSVRRFIAQARRWFAKAATEHWNVTVELSL